MKLSKFSMCLDPKRQEGEDFDAYKERQKRLTAMAKQAGKRANTLFASTFKGGNGKIMSRTAINREKVKVEDIMGKKGTAHAVQTVVDPFVIPASAKAQS